MVLLDRPAALVAFRWEPICGEGRLQGAQGRRCGGEGFEEVATVHEVPETEAQNQQKENCSARRIVSVRGESVERVRLESGSTACLLRHSGSSGSWQPPLTPSQNRNKLRPAGCLRQFLRIGRTPVRHVPSAC